MPGVGNGPGGCPCGYDRAQNDPVVVHVSTGAFLAAGPGERASYQRHVLRACRGCATVYAVTAESDQALPKVGQWGK